jgi:hypothetical protein
MRINALLALVAAAAFNVGAKSCDPNESSRPVATPQSRPTSPEIDQLRENMLAERALAAAVRCHVSYVTPSNLTEPTRQEAIEAYDAARRAIAAWLSQLSSDLDDPGPAYGTAEYWDFFRAARSNKILDDIGRPRSTLMSASLELLDGVSESQDCPELPSSYQPIRNCAQSRDVLTCVAVLEGTVFGDTHRSAWRLVYSQPAASRAAWSDAVSDAIRSTGWE